MNRSILLSAIASAVLLTLNPLATAQLDELRRGQGQAFKPTTARMAGDLAFRQHMAGHTPNPNWHYFLSFAERQFDAGGH
jgi:hypothetical protein